MARFRLRFLLQEFDLTGPAVVIGRSPDCHITIEDPLISREHARITVHADKAIVEDLGSRNGVRVNGNRVTSATTLTHGDRLRLGTQELVFLAVKRSERRARTTGFMSVCAACGVPYPEQAKMCPHCGGSERPEDDTISGLVLQPRRNWTFQLLGEVIEKALSAQRSAEAHRLMARAAGEVDDCLAEGSYLEPDQLETICSYALRLARLLGSAEWVDWALQIHRRHELLPADRVLDLLEGLDGSVLRGATDAMATLSGWARQQPGRLDRAALERLERLAASAAAS